jgi:hypothetical protein
VTEILTGDFLFAWCVSAVTLVIEHWVCQPPEIPYWPRYVLGVLALLAGAFAYEYVSGRPARADRHQDRHSDRECAGGAEAHERRP